MKTSKQLLKTKYGNAVFQKAEEVYNLAKKRGTTESQISEVLPPSGNILQDANDSVENTEKNDNRQDCWSSLLLILMVIVVVGLVIWFFFGGAIIAIKVKAPWWTVVLDILFPIIVVVIIAKINK